MPNFVSAGIAEWHDVIHHRIDALCLREWKRPAVQCWAKTAVQENGTVPRNVVFFGVDPNEFGTVIAYCNPLDREATEARVKETGGICIDIRLTAGAHADG